jgi:hypothetical protein
MTHREGTGQVGAEEDFKPGELLPCPFCGAGVNRLDVQTYWTGMHSVPVSYSLRHWCMKSDGVLNDYREIRGKTREAAITQWNTRTLT